MIISFSDYIKGDCGIKNYENYVGIFSYSHSVDYSVQPMINGYEEGSFYYAPFTLTKNIDENTQIFFKLLQSKTIIPEVHFIHFSKDFSKEYIGLYLKRCTICNVAISGFEGDENETVMISYEDISWGNKNTVKTSKSRSPDF